MTDSREARSRRIELDAAYTETEMRNFDQDRYERKMPGNARLRARRGLALMKASLQRLKKRKRT